MENGVHLVFAALIVWGIWRAIRHEKEASFEQAVTEAKRDIDAPRGRRIYLQKDALAPTIIPHGNDSLAVLSEANGIQPGLTPNQE